MCDEETRHVVFKDIPGHPGYRAGSDGTIWTEWSLGNKPRRTGVWKLLKGGRQHHGHLQYDLKGKRRYGHRLVLEAFVGSCPPGMQCCHENDIPDDNRIENLRWGTPKSNGEDRVRNGRMPRGEKHGRAKLTEGEVREILALRGKLLQKEIAERFGVGRWVIQYILSGRSWNHVTGLTNPYHT
jgi:hypothetical protein